MAKGSPGGISSYLKPALFSVISNSCLKHHSGSKPCHPLPSKQRFTSLSSSSCRCAKSSTTPGGKNLAPTPALSLKTESSCSRAGAPNYLLHYRLSLLFALIRACCLFSFQKKSHLRFPVSVTAHSSPSLLTGHPNKVQRLAAVPSACSPAWDPSPPHPSLSVYTPTHSLIVSSILISLPANT